MLKIVTKLAFVIGIISLFSGCTTQANQPSTYKAPTTDSSFDKLIVNLADQLQSSNELKNKKLGPIAITSFVDLHKLNKTTHFGRTLAESMFNELHVRGMKITEFRAQKSIVINAQGEYYVSRDYKKLKTAFVNKYVLIGTYSYFGTGYTINARIIDNETGIVLASARTIYANTNCSLAENCSDIKPKAKVRTIKITTDDCFPADTCPKNCVTPLCQNS